MNNFYWVSCKKFTCVVNTKEKIIIKTAPILKRFKGQELKNLINWMKKNYKDVKIKKVK